MDRWRRLAGPETGQEYNILVLKELGNQWSRSGPLARLLHEGKSVQEMEALTSTRVIYPKGGEHYVHERFGKTECKVGPVA